MGKRQVHFEFDEYLWQQFQTLYQRQGRKVFEDTMRSMINLKLDITDEEGEKLKSEREDLQKKVEALSSCLKDHDMKLRVWEAKKREELLKKEHEEKVALNAAMRKADAIDASGILREVDFV